MLDRTVRSNNWIRSDTIFIESEQIEALRTARPGSRLCIEKAASRQTTRMRATTQEGISPAENIILSDRRGSKLLVALELSSHRSENLMAYYQALPAWFDRINRKVGYRVRPSFIWNYEEPGYLGLISALPTTGSRVFRACCG